MILRRLLLVVLCCLVSRAVVAASLSDIQVDNGDTQSTVTLSFMGKPTSSWFSLHNPERFVIDIHESGAIKGLPLNFSGANLVKRIRTSQPPNKSAIRLVFELTQPAGSSVSTKQKGKQWQVAVTLTGNASKAVKAAPQPMEKNPFSATEKTVTNSNTTSYPGGQVMRNQVVIVAIDAGHGGQDPGAIGQHGLKEKNVTISIARKLKKFLDADPMFKPVLTRNGNYFISVMGRSEVARRENASLLVSIHADSAPVHSASGASVWVLSNRRANSEMANWLEQKEKQSELLGGAGDLLANSQSDPYLSQAVLDLQFGHSQRVGYDVATKVLQNLRQVTPLHKRLPEHASLGVLRSPDIPSLLVETGFISNAQEEKLLGNSAYQTKIAQAIYRGLRAYFRSHPYQFITASENRPMPASDSGKSVTPRSLLHVVQRGETLSGIAVHYGVSPQSIITQNSLKKPGVWVGQRLRISVTSTSQSSLGKVIKHKVVRGDSLNAIALKYGVSAQTIMTKNKLRSANVMLGQTLTIPRP